MAERISSNSWFITPGSDPIVITYWWGDFQHSDNRGGRYAYGVPEGITAQVVTLEQGMYRNYQGPGDMSDRGWLYSVKVRNDGPGDTVVTIWGTGL